MEWNSALHYKSCLSICTLVEQTIDSLMTDIQGVIYDSLYQISHMEIPFRYFVSHGSLSSPDNSRRITTGSVRNETGAIDIWAVKLRLQDCEFRRRTWYHQISLSADRETNTIQLGYALTYSDYTAGMYGSLPVPYSKTPQLVLDVMNSQTFACVQSDYYFTQEPVQLNKASSEMFLKILYDKKRIIPLMVISCTQAMDASLLANTMAGNAVIFVVTSPVSLNYINRQLPQDLAIPKGAVMIFKDIKGDTVLWRVHAEDEIANRGELNFSNAMRRAFCEQLRSSEKRYLISIEDIQIAIDRKMLTASQEKNTNLSTVVDQLNRENDTLSKELSAATAILDRDLASEIKEHEKLLDTCIKETDSLKNQMSDVTKRLYQGENVTALLEDTPCCSALAHLIDAISYRLTAAILNGHRGQRPILEAK